MSAISEDASLSAVGGTKEFVMRIWFILASIECVSFAWLLIDFSTAAVSSATVWMVSDRSDDLQSGAASAFRPARDCQLDFRDLEQI